MNEHEIYKQGKSEPYAVGDALISQALICLVYIFHICLLYKAFKINFF